MQFCGIDLSTLGPQLEPPSKDKILLLDGDFLVYKAAATVKKLDTAVRRFYQLVLEEMFCAGCGSCRVYITPTGCAKCQRFHLPTVKQYQAQRKSRQELPLRTPLKLHLMNNPDEYGSQGLEVISSYWFEADDLLVMDSYTYGDRAILSSADKDLQLAPGPKVNNVTGAIEPALTDLYGHLVYDDTLANPVIGRGAKYFLYQMLAGDDADNVKGIITLDGKNCGKKTAYAAIEPFDKEQDAVEFVVRAYAAISQDVLAEAECLWLRRTEDDTAYKYFMEHLVSADLIQWVTALHTYHTEYLEWVKEQQDV